MTQYYKIAKSTSDILGATYCGCIPWVIYHPKTGEECVATAHYYVHDDDRRFIRTEEDTKWVVRELLKAVNWHREQELLDANH